MNNNFDLEKFLQDNQCPVCKLPLSVSKNTLSSKVQYACAPLNVVCHYAFDIYYMDNAYKKVLSCKETMLYVPYKVRTIYSGIYTYIFFNKKPNKI